jgi:hypothetical protein
MTAADQSDELVIIRPALPQITGFSRRSTSDQISRTFVLAVAWSGHLSSGYEPFVLGDTHVRDTHLVWGQVLVVLTNVAVVWSLNDRRHHMTMASAPWPIHMWHQDRASPDDQAKLNIGRDIARARTVLRYAPELTEPARRHHVARRRL